MNKTNIQTKEQQQEYRNNWLDVEDDYFTSKFEAMDVGGALYEQ